MRFASAFALALIPQAALANSALWFDPDLGCGRGAVFVRTNQVADLPGCSGRLPKSPPQVEVALHDAKRALLDADAALSKGKLEKVDAALAEVEKALAQTPPLHPELPDRWEEALPLYRRTVASVRARRKLAPRMARLAQAHRDAVEAHQGMTAHEREGGPAHALDLADQCLKEMEAAKADGVDFAADVELEKGRLRPLDEARADCEKAHAQAGPLVAAEQASLKARRTALRKKLRGDRLKIFDQHDGAFPELAGGKIAAAAIARVPVWRYAGITGIEVFTFKGNKLAQRTVETPPKK